MKRQRFFKQRELNRLGAAALAVAGLLWCVKAGVILATGHQPPLAFELGQIVFPLGMIGFAGALPRAGRLGNAGLGLAFLGLLGALLALLYPLVPGVQISTNATFVFPYSLFVLVGTVGGFAGLLLVGMQILGTDFLVRPWHRVPLIVGLLPLPLMGTALVHMELPILFIGITWLILACSSFQWMSRSGSA